MDNTDFNKRHFNQLIICKEIAKQNFENEAAPLVGVVKIKTNKRKIPKRLGMAFVLKDVERTFIGCFSASVNDEFCEFFATDFKEGQFIEKVTALELVDRSEEINESIRFKPAKIIQILQKNTPDSCVVIDSRFELTFTINAHQFKIFFNVRPCSPSEAASFSAGLMKVAIENTLLIDRMKRALEAKDMEIEEYKINGATLIRETLATKKFDFEQELQLSTVKMKEEAIVIDSSALLKTVNLPALCSAINAENVLEKLETKHKSESSQRVKVMKTRSRQPVVHKLLIVVDKKFEYVEDEGDEADVAEETRSPKKKSDQPFASQKKSKIVKKIFEL